MSVTETTLLGTRVPVEMAEDIRRIAEAHDRSTAAEIRIALKAHIAATALSSVTGVGGHHDPVVSHPTNNLPGPVMDISECPRCGAPIHRLWVGWSSAEGSEYIIDWLICETDGSHRLLNNMFPTIDGAYFPGGVIPLADLEELVKKYVPEIISSFLVP